MHTNDVGYTGTTAKANGSEVGGYALAGALSIQIYCHVHKHTKGLLRQSEVTFEHSHTTQRHGGVHVKTVHAHHCCLTLVSFPAYVLQAAILMGQLELGWEREHLTPPARRPWHSPGRSTQ